MDKLKMLRQWGEVVARAAHGRKLLGTCVPVNNMAVMDNPRAGILEFNAGLATGDVLAVLRKNDSALARQHIPWQFPGDPAIYLRGRNIRMEVLWGGTTGPVIGLPDRVTADGEWLAGQAAANSTITCGVSRRIANWLIAGQTGSGKSAALRLPAYQLSRQGNTLVILDAKYGEGLGVCNNLPNLVGPVATATDDILRALYWCVTEMERRYNELARGKSEWSKLIIIFDEAQTYFDSDNRGIKLMAKLVNQGRAVDVHVITGTQKPTHEAFQTSAIRGAFAGRMSLHVEDKATSALVLPGEAVNAFELGMQGDTYVAAPSVPALRMQLFFVPDTDFQQGGKPRYGSWGGVDVSADPGRTIESGASSAFTYPQLALAIIGAKGYRAGKQPSPWGKPMLRDMIARLKIGPMGTDRVGLLRDEGRGLLGALEELGCTITVKK